MDKVQLDAKTKAQIIMQRLAQVEQGWYANQVDVSVAKACDDQQMEQRAKANMRDLQRKKDAYNEILAALAEGDDEPTS